MGVIIIANHQRKLWNEKQHVCKSKIKNISKPSALSDIDISKIYQDRHIVTFNCCIISLLARLTEKTNTRKVTLVSP